VHEVQSYIDMAIEKGEYVSAWDAIHASLLKHNIAYKSHSPPENVGVHEQNRSGIGVGGAESHHHGSDILSVGFSWQKADDAKALECPPAPWDTDAKEINNKPVEYSSGYIPELTMMKLLSVGSGSGHTNSFLRAVKAGCPSAVQKLAN
jgi:hypothetical protein